MSTDAALALHRLARRYGVTNRKMLERLIIAADKEITAKLELDSPEWMAYFRVTP